MALFSLFLKHKDVSRRKYKFWIGGMDSFGWCMLKVGVNLLFCGDWNKCFFWGGAGEILQIYLSYCYWQYTCHQIAVGDILFTRYTIFKLSHVLIFNVFYNCVTSFHRMFEKNTHFILSEEFLFLPRI